MPLTEKQQEGVRALKEEEKSGSISFDRQELLDDLRERKLVKPNPFSLADQSPIPFDEKKERNRATKLTGPNMPVFVDVELLDFRRALAESGQMETALEPLSNLKLGLSAFPKKEIETILNSQFGQKVDVRFDPLPGKKGRFQYIDPKTNRIVNVGVEGLDLGDIIQASGETPALVGDIAGTVGGGALGAAIPVPGGALIGQTVGSTGGTFIGELVKLQLGKLVGVNQDLSTDDMIQLAGRKGAIAGGFTLGAGALARVGKSVANFIKGRTGSKEAAFRSGLNEQEAKETIDAVNDLQREFGPIKDEVRLTTAKRSGDEVLLSDESSLRRDKDFVREFTERDTQDRIGLTKAFDAITPSAAGGGDTVGVAFRRVRHKSLSNASKELETAQKTLDSELRALTPQTIGDDGTIVRKAIQDKTIAVNDKVDLVNNQWKRLANVSKGETQSDIKITVGGRVRSLMRTLDTESRNAISNIVRTSRRGALTRKFEESKGGKVVQTGILDKQGNAFTRVTKGSTTDLVDYQKTISAFRQAIREKDKGASALNGQQIVTVKRTLKALVRDRDLFLIKSGRDDIIFSIKNADSFTKEARTMLDRSIVGTIMEKRQGQFSVRNQDIFDKGFVKGGKEQSDEIVKVIGDNEGAMSAWRDNILSKYKREVVGEDGPAIKRHIKFINDFSDSMAPFFNRAEMSKIKQLGGIIKVVERQQKKKDAILKALNTPRSPLDKLQKTLATLDPEEVSPWIVSNFKTGPGRARRVVSLLKSKPRLLEGIRQDARNVFRTEVSPNGIVDPQKLASNLKRNAATYKELFGEKYVDDLFTIKKAFDLSARSGTILLERGATGVETQAARAIFRPLTREGVLFTAFLKFRTLEGRKAISKAMLNPQDLNELAELSVLSEKSRQAFELLNSMGYIAATSEDLEQ